eukprot:215178-Prymnesium_polylepis.1
MLECAIDTRDLTSVRMIAPTSTDAGQAGAAAEGSERFSFEQQQTCAKDAAEQAAFACPGDLQTAWAAGLHKYVCAPPLQAAPRERGPYSFFVNAPRDSEYAALRGRFVTVARGSMDAFLNLSFGWDFSGGQCYKAGVCGTSTQGIAGAVYPADLLRSVPGAGIDGRYVDGISLTIGCAASARGREHVFTLAAAQQQQCV